VTTVLASAGPLVWGFWLTCEPGLRINMRKLQLLQVALLTSLVSFSSGIL
jgi:hypothetical protein